MGTSENIATRDPSLFQQLVVEYCRLIGESLDNQTYLKQGEHRLGEAVPAFAERLGAMRASPRDLVEIHSHCLEKGSSADSPQRFMAIAEEGRLLLLELMGYLSGYYRKLALNLESELGRIGRYGDDV